MGQSGRERLGRLERMQQHDAGYVVVGHNGVLEGLVSKSNVLGGDQPLSEAGLCQVAKA